jgi:AraC family transcriptional regulator
MSSREQERTPTGDMCEHLALENLAQPADRLERRWSGFSVEYVSPSAGASFSYDWASDRHFCAYHDIVLEDGGITAGNGKEDNRSDLRHTLTYVPCGARVSGWSKLSKRRNSFTAIYFDPAAVREEFGTRFSGQLREHVYFWDDEVAGYLRQWSRMLTQRDSDPLYEESLGVITILAIQRSSTFLSEIHPLGRSSLSRVVDFIEQNLGGSISLSELAAISGFSRFHFSRAFKASTGVTPYQHVLTRRVDRAKILLADGDMPLHEIAKRVGFHDTSHFQRAFKLRVGTSAQRFRQGR